MNIFKKKVEWIWNMPEIGKGKRAILLRFN